MESSTPARGGVVGSIKKEVKLLSRSHSDSCPRNRPDVVRHRQSASNNELEKLEVCGMWIDKHVFLPASFVFLFFWYADITLFALCLKT